MLVTCSIGRTSHQSLLLYTVARLDTRWRDIEDGNGLPVTPFTSEMDWEIAEWTKTYGIPSRALNALLAKRGVSLLSSRECNESLTKAYSSLITLASHIKIHENSITSLIASFQDDHVSRHRISRYT